MTASIERVRVEAGGPGTAPLRGRNHPSVSGSSSQYGCHLDPRVGRQALDPGTLGLKERFESSIPFGYLHLASSVRVECPGDGSGSLRPSISVAKR
jgi:hypothetical protein